MVAALVFFNTLEVVEIPGIINQNLLQMWQHHRRSLEFICCCFLFWKGAMPMCLQKNPKNQWIIEKSLQGNDKAIHRSFKAHGK